MKRCICALAVTALFSACGGGGPSEPATTAAAPGKAAPQQKKLAATQVDVVPAEEAARQLMDFGEARFSEYFPTHQPTQSYPPFLFRYYPQTGVYLGVVVTDGMGYVLNGVYAMGGEFGNQPLYVGLLTDFITPEKVNGCYDLALADARGTRTVVTMEYVLVPGSTLTRDRLVGRATTFEGQKAIETSEKVVGRDEAGGFSFETFSFDLKHYASRTGGAEYTTYGSVAVDPYYLQQAGVTATDKRVYTPPQVDKRYALSVGESFTLKYAKTTDTTVSRAGQPDVSNMGDPIAVEKTITFVGRETVTVPAGVYATCRFEIDEVSSDGLSSKLTSWVIAGVGIEVQLASNGEIVQRAKSVTLNGLPL